MVAIWGTSGANLRFYDKGVLLPRRLDFTCWTSVSCWHCLSMASLLIRAMAEARPVEGWASAESAFIGDVNRLSRMCSYFPAGRGIFCSAIAALYAYQAITTAACEMSFTSRRSTVSIFVWCVRTS
jgi:hypothetical protein